MEHNGVVFSIFLIFSGAAVLSTVALYSRQSLLVAYIVLGFVLGPWGLKLVNDANVVHKVDDIGIILLLFLNLGEMRCVYVEVGKNIKFVVEHSKKHEFVVKNNVVEINFVW